MITRKKNINDKKRTREGKDKSNEMIIRTMMDTRSKYSPEIQ